MTSSGRDCRVRGNFVETFDLKIDKLFQKSGYQSIYKIGSCIGQ